RQGRVTEVARYRFLNEVLLHDGKHLIGCVPPFTHTVVQPFAGLSLENLQCRGKGTLLPDRSECNAAELWQTGCRRGFSPAVAAAASLTPSWTHADACPCLFSADTARLAPSGHQRR